LGETAVNISVFAAPVPTSSGAARAALHFLNVHQNENTSVVAAKVLLYYYGGYCRPSASCFLRSFFVFVLFINSDTRHATHTTYYRTTLTTPLHTHHRTRHRSITLLEHGGERLVSFKLEGTVYTFDPNRMFTPVGVEATLKEYGPYSPVAAKHVLAFSQRLLEIYDFNRLPV
jgi:hypothetical protein